METIEHSCDKLAKVLENSKIDDFCIINITISRIENQNWLLTKYYYADDQTVYDGEANYIGEVVSEFSMSIDYCPFCGEKLSKTSVRRLG